MSTTLNPTSLNSTPDTTTDGLFDGIPFALAAHDLYRDIHKGIRAELFAVTGSAGTLDPADARGWAALAEHISSVQGVLEMHARHEDDVVEPALWEFRPELAEEIEADHVRLDIRFARLAEIAQSGAGTPAGDQRRVAHLLYLELSGFTSAYMEHQLVEERVVMPALDAKLGFEAVLDMHQTIIGSIPPEVMGHSLAFMLPAMNVDDRTELLGGMQAGAPPEVFQGVVSLARSVLDPIDFSAVARRLGLD